MVQPVHATALVTSVAKTSDDASSVPAQWRQAPLPGATAEEVKGSSMDRVNSIPPAESPPESNWKNPMYHRVPFILGNEMCERLAFYGLSGNLTVYLTDVMGISNSAAASQVNYWSGTVYMTPLIGGFVADTFLGRFWTIAVFSIIYLLGTIGLTLSSCIPGLKPPGSVPAQGVEVTFFWVMLYIIAIGAGGIKPNVSTFGADQFNEADPREKALIPRFFNYFYFMINVGALFAAVGITTIQQNWSWTAGFAIPAGAFFIAIVLFFSASSRYVRKPPTGSPWASIAKVFASSIRKWRVSVPQDTKQLNHEESETFATTSQLQRTDGLRFLEKAAVRDNPKAGACDNWLCSVNQVEGVKAILRLIPIFLTLIVWNMVYAQMSTLFVEQGSAMEHNIGSFVIPPALLSVFDLLSVLVMVPVYEGLINPFLKTRTKNWNNFKRIGWGFVLAIFSMVAATIVEAVRLQIVSRHNMHDVDPTKTPPNMSVFWQIPQYAFIGAAEVFSNVGAYELFYDQAPENMRSMSMALMLIASGIANYLAGALNSIIQGITMRNGSPGWIADNLNQGHIDYVFMILAVLQVLDLIAYIPIAYLYKPVNRAGQGECDVEQASTSGSKSCNSCATDRRPSCVEISAGSNTNSYGVHLQPAGSANASLYMTPQFMLPVSSKSM